MKKGLCVVVGAGWLVVLAGAARSSTQSPNPVIPQDPSAEAFIGAQACASCHQQKHDLWTSSRHSRMVQPATAASVKGDFSTGGLVLRDDRYRLRAANGAYYITELLSTGAREHRVEYTLGNRRIQHYLTTIDKGRIVVLAPSWDIERGVWFHNMEIVRPDADPTMVQQWNRNCVGCHVSQQDKNYNPDTKTYATGWADFGTSCERCHGPGRAHADQHRSRSTTAAAAMVRPTRLDAGASTMICAQCHSSRTVVAPGFAAGADYYDYFQPALEYLPRAAHDPAYWADGRPRRFSNDALGFWQSKCFLRGGATCTSCHLDPHLPDIERNPQLAPANNALCTGCHQALNGRSTALTAHTRHSAASTGSSCVECHMPKTVISIKATMRDHSISVPAPENTVRFGIPNACTECHADRKPDWAVDTLAKWWPSGRRTTLVAQAAAFSGGREGQAQALEPLLTLARDERLPPLVRANAVGYLGKYPAARARAALLAAAGAEHPAIRLVALSTLGLAPHLRDQAATRRAAAVALDDPKRAVRVTALLSLVNLGGWDYDPRNEQRIVRVSGELAAWARLNEDDAALQRALGIVYLLTGESNLAARALEISIDLEPNGASGKYLLGLARLGQQRTQEAGALFGQVPRSDPYYQNAQEQLKRIPTKP